MVRRNLTALRVGLLFSDAFSAFALVAIVSWIRFGSDWIAVWRRMGIELWIVGAVWATLWITTLWLMNLYRLRSRWSMRTEIQDVVRAAILLALAVFGLLFAVRMPEVSRLFLLWLFGLQVVVTIVSRFAIRTLIRNMRSRGMMTRYMLVVGTDLAARSFANRVERHRELGIRVIGYLHASEADAARVSVSGRPVLGSIDDIEKVLHERIVDEVAVCLAQADLAMIEPVARICEEEGKIVRIPIDEHSMILPGARVEEFDGHLLMSLVYGPDRALALVLKRLSDVILAVLALIVLSALFAIIAVSILLVDGRPVFFRQTRVGLHGRSFKVVKFRSMVPDAELRLADLAEFNEIKGHAFKMSVDPRLSRTGRILRSTSLDELPQLWNVVRGEMSLVGPRPPLLSEVAAYDVWHRRRLSMKPGITGLWQVAARAEEDFDRWVELDLAYIDRWSMWLDMKIMVRTIPAMLHGR